MSARGATKPGGAAPGRPQSGRRELGWREEDEALLRRLEHEELIERLFATLVEVEAPKERRGGAAAEAPPPPPHRRAAGLLALVRGLPDGEPAIEEAKAGRFGALAERMAPRDLKGTPPELLHHLALFAQRLAEAHLAAGRARAAKDAYTFALAAWLALSEEERYLLRFAEQVVGGGLPRSAIEREARGLGLLLLKRLGEQARRGAAERTAEARVALRALRGVGEAAKRAGIAEDRAGRAVRLAERLHEQAVDQALAPIEAALEELLARAHTAREIAAELAKGTAVWAFAGQDPHVEHALVEQALPPSWDAYRDRRWDDLRVILEPVASPVEHLAARIEGDPSQLAYASKCAMVFVFRSDVQKRFDLQISEAERAVKICPTHRNGRATLADLLCERAIRAVATRMVWSGDAALDEAVEDVRRAERLNPDCRRLPLAKEKLAMVGRKL